MTTQVEFLYVVVVRITYRLNTYTRKFMSTDSWDACHAQLDWHLKTTYGAERAKVYYNIVTTYTV